MGRCGIIFQIGCEVVENSSCYNFCNDTEVKKRGSFGLRGFRNVKDGKEGVMRLQNHS